MTNNIQLFKKENLGEIRVLEQNGEVWFVAKDVCEALGYSDTEVALRKLDEDEKLTRKIYGSGQHRDMWLISESGLYTIILRSNKPNAKKFRKWVTGEVLPTIRKTGQYCIGNQEFKKEIIKDILFLKSKNFDKKLIKLRRYFCLGLNEEEIKKLTKISSQEINHYKKMFETMGLIKKVEYPLSVLEEYCLSPELIDWKRIDKLQKRLQKNKNEMQNEINKLMKNRSYLVNEIKLAAVLIQNPNKIIAISKN